MEDFEDMDEEEDLDELLAIVIEAEREDEKKGRPRMFVRQISHLRKSVIQWRAFRSPLLNLRTI